MRRILLFLIMINLLIAGQEIGTVVVTNSDGTLNYIRNPVFSTIKEDEIEYFKAMSVYNEKGSEIARWEIHNDYIYMVSITKIYPEDILDKWICLKSSPLPNVSIIRPMGMKGSKVIIKIIEDDRIQEQEFPIGKFTTIFNDGTKRIDELIDGKMITKYYDENGKLIK